MPAKKWKDGENRNSPVIGNNGLKFESEEEQRELTAKVLGKALKYWNYPIVKNDEEALRRTEEFFSDCIQENTRPTVEMYALCMGTTRQTLFKWETGQLHTIDGDIIKKAKELIATYDAEMVASGKLNPVTYIFRSKNYYGMKDQTDVVVTPDHEKVDVKALIEEAEVLPDD